jgi:hypothetical protein
MVHGSQFDTTTTMKYWHLTSDRVSVRISSIGGFVDQVTIDGHLAPLHTAPWLNETLPDDIPPMLAHLSGDFFCAPFGAADVDPTENRPHGATANREWIPLEVREDAGHWVLDGTVNGASVHKHVWLEAGEPMVYQEHVLIGGSGSIPVAHHLMLKVNAPIELRFAPYEWIGTPPEAVEPDPTIGRSLLAYNRVFEKIEEAPLADGTTVDLSVYPTMDRHEDIIMLRTRRDLEKGWVTAVCREEDWMFFAEKDTATLPGTVLWMSNGGRDYAPWNGRHTGVIGIEETCSWFHLGHKASTEPNPLSEAGYPTALQLEPGVSTRIRYAFGFRFGLSDTD